MHATYSPRFCVRCLCSVAKSRLTFCDPMDCMEPARLLCLWDFPGKHTGVGCHFLLQEVFPTQGLNPCLLHWQVGSSALSQQGSPWEGPVVTHISEGPALLCPRGSQNLRSLLSLGCCACARMLMRVGFTRGQLPPQNMRTQTTPTPQSDG